MYEAELIEPQAPPPIVLPFYQRKGFVSVMVAVTLLAIVTLVGVLLSNNLEGNATSMPSVPPTSSHRPTQAPSQVPTLNKNEDFLQIGDWRIAAVLPTTTRSLSYQPSEMSATKTPVGPGGLAAGFRLKHVMLDRISEKSLGMSVCFCICVR